MSETFLDTLVFTFSLPGFSKFGRKTSNDYVGVGQRPFDAPLLAVWVTRKVILVSFASVHTLRSQAYGKIKFILSPSVCMNGYLI